MLGQECTVPALCGISSPPYKVICASGSEVFSNTLYGQQLLSPLSGLNTPQFIVIFGTLVIAENYTFAAGSVIILTDDSSIRIQGGAHLTVNATHVRGCDKLWDNIQVDANAKLTATRSTIEDAKVAINLKNNASLYLQSCHFKQNFICIFSKQSVSASLGIITVKGCSFSGAEQLPETHFYNCNAVGPNDSQANYPLYAVEVSNTTSFSFGTGSNNSDRNLIRDYLHAPILSLCIALPTGVRAINSNVTIRNTRFINIGTGGTPIEMLEEIGGRGVDFFSANGSHKLTFTGLGENGVSTFQNCHWFLFSRQGRVQISDVLGIQTVLGIEIQNAPNTFGSVTIANSRIEGHVQRGIQSIAEVFPAGQTTITNTTVNDNSDDQYMGDPQQPAPTNRSGFTLMNNTVPSTSTHLFYLYNNTFRNFNKGFFVDGTYGFDINRMTNVTANRNVVINDENLADVSDAYAGFKILLGRSNTYSHNQVFSTAILEQDYNPVGIRVENSGRSNFYCNFLDNFRRNFFFTGLACDQTKLIRNEMLTDNTVGLFLAAPTIIGVQNDFDNSWPNDLNTTVEEARFNTNPFNQGFINQSAVRVFEQEMPGSAAWPQPRFPGQGIWFQSISANNNLQCPVDEFQTPVDERTVADGNVLNNQFPAYMGYPATVWDAKFRLFEKLVENPELRPIGSQEESFYNAELNSNLGKLSAALTGVSKLGEPSAIMLVSMSAQADNLDSLLLELELIDSTLEMAQDSQEIADLLVHRTAKVVEIENAGLAYSQTLATWSDEVSTRLQNLNTQLAAITTVFTWEQNLKSVLGVALRADA